MEGVKDIINNINEAMINAFIANTISQTSAFGIADMVTGGPATFPVYFATNDGTWAGFDDRKHIILYHKFGTVQSRQVKGYGDSNDINNTYTMSLVIYYNSTATKLRSDELFAFVQAVMPEKVTISPFNYIRNTISGAILNTQQVFSTEYKGIAYSLKPEQNLISINYTIETQFKKGCFSCCT
jgi:hypothetical protein